MVSTKTKYVGDLIQLSEIRKWNIGDTILISAPTGSGKSFWVEKYLCLYCRETGKKILWLTNRNLLREQINFIAQENKDIITIVNYQKIESYMKYRNKIPIHFNFVVADECHYFFTDATFNKETDLTFSWLLNRKDCIKILLSATGKLTEEYLKQMNVETIKYEIPQNYNYIENFYFYNDDKVIQKLIFQLPENEKAIYFASAEKAFNMNKLFSSNSAFICSNNRKEYQSNAKIKEQIIENEKFDCQILCTTSVLDNGVNIKDESVKHIIIDYFDLDTIQQCLGRKRILNENDKINVYIKNRRNKSLNGTKQQYMKKLEQAEYLINYGQIKFVKKYGRNLEQIIYIENDENNSTKIKYNKMMYAKYTSEIKLIKEMMLIDDGFIQAVLKRFKLTEWKLLDNEYDKITLEDKLEKYVGVKMFKDEQKEFKEFINENVIKIIAGSKDSLGYHTINNRFEELNLPYRIENKKERSRKSKKYNKYYWIIRRLI